MSWNYRRVKTIDPLGEICINVHEVYYDPDGAPRAVTEEEVGPFGAGETDAEAEDECAGSYAMMQRAFELPVLDYETLAAGTTPVERGDYTRSEVKH